MIYFCERMLRILSAILAEDIINEKCTNKTFNDCEGYIPNENRIKEYF